MADYPSYPRILTSQQDDEPGIADDFSQPGQQHSRIFHPEAYSRFEVIHHCTWSEYKTLRALYDAGPRDELTNFFYHEVSPAEIYTVKFLARPKITQNLGDATFWVTVNVRGTLN